MNQQLLRRAWDALDSFKQSYPENWHEDDEQVMVDLMRADMKLSGVQPKWVGLTDEEIDQGLLRSDYAFKTAEAWRAGVVFAMTKLKEKNSA